MNRKAILWAITLATAATLVETGTILGNSQPGPRIGITAFLAVLALTVLTVGNVEWYLRRTTKPADYQGTCPVGESCEDCGAFNYKPRQICRSCKAPVNQIVAET